MLANNPPPCLSRTRQPGPPERNALPEGIRTRDKRWPCEYSPTTPYPIPHPTTRPARTKRRTGPESGGRVNADQQPPIYPAPDKQARTNECRAGVRTRGGLWWCAGLHPGLFPGGGPRPCGRGRPDRHRTGHAPADGPNPRRSARYRRPRSAR